jgi:hypothetical protein
LSYSMTVIETSCEGTHHAVIIGPLAEMSEAIKRPVLG